MLQIELSRVCSGDAFTLRQIFTTMYSRCDEQAESNGSPI